MKKAIIILVILIAMSQISFGQYMGSDDVITITDSIQIDTLDNNIKYDNWVEFVENHSGAEPETIDTVFFERGDDGAVILKDTVGTMINHDFWAGSAAEYSAGTVKNGISPTGTNTIAFILNGFNPLIFLFLIMSFFNVSGQAWDSIKANGGDCDSVMRSAVKIWEKETCPYDLDEYTEFYYLTVTASCSYSNTQIMITSLQTAKDALDLYRNCYLPPGYSRSYGRRNAYMITFTIGLIVMQADWLKNVICEITPDGWYVVDFTASVGNSIIIQVLDGMLNYIEYY